MPIIEKESKSSQTGGNSLLLIRLIKGYKKVEINPAR
jgi:hypothetical protein